jgi:hypothetical protein
VNTRNLHTSMAALAEEVLVVDLRNRVLTSSHRTTVRRRILVAAAAAVATVAAASCVACAGVSQGAIAPAPTVAAEPSRGALKNAVRVPRRLFYLGNERELQRLDGSTTSPMFEARTRSCGLTVSPDRTRIAYVISDGGGATGDLVVAGLTGSGRRTVLTDVSCMGGNSPLWLPGSRQLLLTQGNGAPRTVVDVATRRVGATPLKNVRGYVAWSANGSYVAYAETGKIVVARRDGTVVRRVAHGDESPAGGFSVQGVSGDGTRVVAGVRNTDPGFVRTGKTVVDLRTGDTVPLPRSIAPKDPFQAAIYFLPDDNLLVRVVKGKIHMLYAVSPAGQVRDSRAEPSGLRTVKLLPSF